MLKGLPLLLLGLVCSALSFTAAACQWRFAAENDFPPHLIQVNEQHWQGQTVELLQALAAKAQCQIKFVSSPWLRSLVQLKNGELDVISHLYKNSEREKDYYFLGPHHLEGIWLIGKPEQFKGVHQLTDTLALNPKPRIAVLNGAYYGETFARTQRDANFAAQLVPISSIQDKLALLNAGRVDAILEDSSVLQYWQHHKAKNAALYQPIVLVYQAPVYFGFSKKTISAEQFAKLEAAWQQLVDAQAVQQIQQRYH